MNTTRGIQLSGPITLLLLAAAIIASFLASSGPVQWMDNGMFLADATEGNFFSDSLGPLSHPSYQFFITGFYTLFGMHVLSLMNSILLFPMTLLVYGIASSVGVSRNLAILAAAAAVLGHSMFWVSTKSEVYLLHTVFVLGAYWLYFDNRTSLGLTARLLLIGVLTGIGAGIHQLTFIVLLPLYVQLLVQYRARIWLTVPGFALGFAVSLPAILNDMNEGLNLFEIIRRFLTGTDPRAVNAGWESSLFRFDMLWHEKNAVTLLALSLIGPQIFGLVFFPKTRPLQLLWAALILNLAFAVSYNVHDRFEFFLPGVALASILGVVQLSQRLPQNRTGAGLLYLSPLAGPVAVLVMWVIYSNGMVKLPVHTEALPFRNDIHYFMVPYLQDRSAEEFVRTYETLAPPGSLIIADWTPMGALRSAQAAGLLNGRKLEGCERAKDIGVYMAGAGAFLPRTSYCGHISDDYRLDKNLVGYRLQAK